ncbi:MAG TPA: type II toxin-antitoxin system PemK/MazF family toxin [Candidatus Paceibacterota bacterium]
MPSSGDIIWVSFGLTKGREQSGRRPAIVLSHREYSKLSGLVIVCPITTKIKGYNVEVPITINGVNSTILADQIKSVDLKGRGIEYLTTTNKEVLLQVLEIIRALLYI